MSDKNQRLIEGRRIGFLGSGLMAQGICKGLLESGTLLLYGFI